jgi:Tol biopolymer transport system component
MKRFALFAILLSSAGLSPNALSKLTVNERDNTGPAWGPDGRSVAFVSDQSGGRDLYRPLADDSRPETLLLHEKRLLSEVVLSHDGAWVIYRIGVNAGEGDL